MNKQYKKPWRLPTPYYRNIQKQLSSTMRRSQQQVAALQVEVKLGGENSVITSVWSLLVKEISDITI